MNNVKAFINLEWHATTRGLFLHGQARRYWIFSDLKKPSLLENDPL